MEVFFMARRNQNPRKASMVNAVNGKTNVSVKWAVSF